MRIFKKSGLSNSHNINIKREPSDEISSLNERVSYLMNFSKTTKLRAKDMIFFIMYDISNDKVRHQVSKYLERKGCFRIQKSIFIAHKERKDFTEIHTALKEVQECYDNEDSIFIVPISTDTLNSMKVIGQNIDFDMIMGNQNTIIF